MSKELQYKVKLSVIDTVDEEALEEFLQQLLIDLYEQGDVESITVTKDGYMKTDEDMQELLEIISDLKSSEIMKAIKMVEEHEGNRNGQ